MPTVDCKQVNCEKLLAKLFDDKSPPDPDYEKVLVDILNKCCAYQGHWIMPLEPTTRTRPPASSGSTEVSPMMLVPVLVGAGGRTITVNAPAAINWAELLETLGIVLLDPVFWLFILVALRAITPDEPWRVRCRRVSNQRFEDTFNACVYNCDGIIVVIPAITIGPPNTGGGSINPLPPITIRGRRCRDYVTITM